MSRRYHSHTPIRSTAEDLLFIVGYYNNEHQPHASSIAKPDLLVTVWIVPPWFVSGWPWPDLELLNSFQVLPSPAVVERVPQFLGPKNNISDFACSQGRDVDAIALAEILWATLDQTQS